MCLPRPRSRRPFVSGLALAMVSILMTLLNTRAFASTKQLTCSPTQLKYGQIVVKEAETLLVTVTNGGESSVTISSVSSNNSSFKVLSLHVPQVLAAGASLDVSVSFTPTDVAWEGGQISFISNATNSTLIVPVAGSGVTSESVTANPASLSFGNVAVGATSTLPITLTNMRASKVVLNSLQIFDSAFSISGASFPLTLEAGQSVKLKATFKPQESGLIGASFLVYGPGVSVPLTGTGTSVTKPELTVSPSPLNFGNVAVDTTETIALSLKATGESVRVSSISSNSSPFEVTGVDLPLTVPAGQEVSVNVTFTPKKDGAASGALSFSSNAANSPTSDNVSGAGTAPYVSLSWNASTSENVTGYNVYRATSKNGSQTKLNPSVDATTTYTDKTVAPGSTYYYSTTAVNSKGQESPHSEAVEVVVP